MIETTRGVTPVYTPVCDGCGTELDTEYEFRVAVNAMRAAGWRTEYSFGMYTHLCPACAGRCDFGK